MLLFLVQARLYGDMYASTAAQDSINVGRRDVSLGGLQRFLGKNRAERKAENLLQQVFLGGSSGVHEEGTCMNRPTKCKSTVCLFRYGRVRLGCGAC